MPTTPELSDGPFVQDHFARGECLRRWSYRACIAIAFMLSSIIAVGCAVFEFQVDKRVDF